MFTGIIEQIGTILDIKSSGDFYSIKIKSPEILNDTRQGDSIAVNGVCLTVTAIDVDSFYADVMKETLDKTSLRNVAKGTKVNLERAATLNTRLGGHLVSGHVDGLGKIIEKKFVSNSYIYRIQIDKELSKFIADKGSIAIDGISLTVVKCFEDSFTISIIPHTMRETILSEKSNGDVVNIEVDVLARYVVNYVELSKNDSKVDWDSIAQNGF